MIRARLNRTSFGADGVFGVLSLREIPLCITCENPWLDNRQNVSCIPAGIYQCVPHNGFKYKDCWRLLDVPGRSAILIHAGNTIRDTEGCILPGLQLGTLKGLPAVLQSKAAMTRLRDVLPETFILEVHQ